MFERFTEAARQAVVKAQEEARTLGHNWIGTEHVLLGLLSEQDQIAGSALRSVGVTAERVRDQLVTIVGRGEEPTEGQIPFTPRAKKVMELGLREALSLGHNYIGTEHLLLGLLRESEGVAMRILLDLNIKPDEIRAAVIAMVPGPDQGPPQPRGRHRHGAASAVGSASAVVRRTLPEVGFTAMPDARTRRVLMRAAARALADARTEFTVEDLAFAVWGDEDAAAAIATLAASERATETTPRPPPPGAEPGPPPVP